MFASVQNAGPPEGTISLSDAFHGYSRIETSLSGEAMAVWRINVLKDGIPDVTRDITAETSQERDIIELLRLMAAQGLTSAEIIDAFWSESHGRVSLLTVQPHGAGQALSCGGERYHATARRL